MRFGWPTPIVWGRCHREPAMQIFRRSTAAPYASPLFCRSAGWGLFFECQRKQTPGERRDASVFCTPADSNAQPRKNVYRVCNCPRRGLGSDPNSDGSVCNRASRLASTFAILKKAFCNNVLHLAIHCCNLITKTFPGAGPRAYRICNAICKTGGLCRGGLGGGGPRGTGLSERLHRVGRTGGRLRLSASRFFVRRANR